MTQPYNTNAQHSPTGAGIMKKQTISGNAAAGPAADSSASGSAAAIAPPPPPITPTPPTKTTIMNPGGIPPPPTAAAAAAASAAAAPASNRMTPAAQVAPTPPPAKQQPHYRHKRMRKAPAPTMEELLDHDLQHDMLQLLGPGPMRFGPALIPPEITPMQVRQRLAEGSGNQLGDYVHLRLRLEAKRKKQPEQAQKLLISDAQLLRMVQFCHSRDPNVMLSQTVSSGDRAYDLLKKSRAYYFHLLVLNRQAFIQQERILVPIPQLQLQPVLPHQQQAQQTPTTSSNNNNTFLRPDTMKAKMQQQLLQLQQQNQAAQSSQTPLMQQSQHHHAYAKSRVLYFRPSRFFPKKQHKANVIDTLVYILDHWTQTDAVLFAKHSFTQPQPIQYCVMVHLQDFDVAHNFSKDYWSKFMAVLQGKVFPVCVSTVLWVDPPPAFDSKIWHLTQQMMITPNFAKANYKCTRKELHLYLQEDYQEFLPVDEFSDVCGEDGIFQTTNPQNMLEEMAKDYIIFQKYLETIQGKTATSAVEEKGRGRGRSRRRFSLPKRLKLNRKKKNKHKETNSNTQQTTTTNSTGDIEYETPERRARSLSVGKRFRRKRKEKREMKYRKKKGIPDQVLSPIPSGSSEDNNTPPIIFEEGAGPIKVPARGLRPPMVKQPSVRRNSQPLSSSTRRRGAGLIGGFPVVHRNPRRSSLSVLEELQHEESSMFMSELKKLDEGDEKSFNGSSVGAGLHMSGSRSIDGRSMDEDVRSIKSSSSQPRPRETRRRVSLKAILKPLKKLGGGSTNKSSKKDSASAISDSMNSASHEFEPPYAVSQLTPPKSALRRRLSKQASNSNSNHTNISQHSLNLLGDSTKGYGSNADASDSSLNEDLDHIANVFEQSMNVSQLTPPGAGRNRKKSSADFGTPNSDRRPSSNPNLMMRQLMHSSDGSGMNLDSSESTMHQEGSESNNGGYLFEDSFVSPEKTRQESYDWDKILSDVKANDGSPLPTPHVVKRQMMKQQQQQQQAGRGHAAKPRRHSSTTFETLKPPPLSNSPTPPPSSGRVVAGSGVASSSGNKSSQDLTYFMNQVQRQKEKTRRLQQQRLAAANAAAAANATSGMANASWSPKR